MAAHLPDRLAALRHDPQLEELAFDPVPVKNRSDGWTAERQHEFILFLAAGCGVSKAAAASGMSRQSAYALRDRAGAASFAAAWDRALARARSPQAPPGPTIYERGVEGVLVPLRHRGRILGYRRKYDDRVLVNLLRAQYRRREQVR